MNNNNNNSTKGGVGFVGLLTLTFIILKLVGVINWSWWWVLSPSWISLIICVLLIIIFSIYRTHMINKYNPKSSKRRK